METYVVPKATGKQIKTYLGGGSEPPKFMPTFYEWLREQGTQIIQGGSVTLANDYGMYTVPTGYVLFINSIYLDTNLAAAGQAIIFLAESSAIKLIALNGARAVTIEYPIPLQLPGKKQLVLSTLAAGLVQYGFSGFLIEKSLIPQI